MDITGKKLRATACIYSVLIVSLVPNASGKAGAEACMAEGVEEGEGDRRREVVEIKRYPPPVREIAEIMKLSDKPRSQQQQYAASRFPGASKRVEPRYFAVSARSGGTSAVQGRYARWQRATPRVRVREESRGRLGNATRDESGRGNEFEAPRPETNGSRSEAESIGNTSICRPSLSGFTIILIYVPGTYLSMFCILLSSYGGAYVISNQDPRWTQKPIYPPICCTPC